MRRLDLVPTTVVCPHFKRPVAAQRNLAIDRLVSCTESDACRAPAASDGSRPFPAGCPVFPSLTTQTTR